MAQFIPEISITDFKKLKAHQLKRLKSCEVYSDRQYLFTFVNGMTVPGGYLRTQTEYNCQNANAVGGESLEQILEKELVST
jgi:hypothetical protein